MRLNGGNLGPLIIVLVIGAIIGGLITELLAKINALSWLIPYFYTDYSVFAMEPLTIDLFIIKITFSGSFSPNIMSILGIVIAFVLYRRH